MSIHKTVDCVIFDVDGTIANCDHRRHWLLHTPRNWKAFNARIYDDEPIDEVCFIAQCFNKLNVPIVIATARSEDVHEITKKWITEKAQIKFDAFYGRSADDYRDDDIVKEEFLYTMRSDGWNPLIVFDDRDKVVKMWRKNGLRTCQVDYGDF